MKSHSKICISIPTELDNLINRIVEESKSTSKPLTKSSLFVAAIHSYLGECIEELNTLNKGGKN